MESHEYDERMRSLVEALSRIPEVTPFSSCGGHRLPQRILAQCGEDEFYVNFTVEPTKGGWRSLECIALAVNQVDPKRLKLFVWSGEEPGALAIELRGTDGADPDELAKYLDDVLPLLMD